MKPTVKLLIACLAAGCASVSATPDAAPQHRVGQSVKLNEVTETSVGDVIFAQFDYIAFRRAVIDAPYSRPVLPFGSFRIQPGQTLFPSVVEGRDAWCSSNPTYFVAGDNRSACYFDGSGSGRFSQAYIVGTLQSIRYDVDVPYTIQEVPAGRGFKYELLYEGIDRGVVRISYREYSNDFARPAFQQELSYTLEPAGHTTEVSFRGVRLAIEAAGNNSIRYRVLSAFR
jgi:hypothetical protein